MSDYGEQVITVAEKLQNSVESLSLSKAINYMHNHWLELTLFLSVEKAPLDNNTCEKAIKMAILHRNHSLFYKLSTEHISETCL